MANEQQQAMRFEGRDIRILYPEDVIGPVAAAAVKACRELPPDVIAALERALDRETEPDARENLELLLKNAHLAKSKALPICQDTGAAVVLCEVGDAVYFLGTDQTPTLTDAINKGIAKGYGEGLLRASMVADPLFRRTNTGDNTPAIIHYKYVKGDTVHIIVEPKGFGCENKSAATMLNPVDGVEGVRRWVVDTALMAGPNACPPFVLGVGIGGSLDDAAVKSKWALHRQLGTSNPHPDPELAWRYSALEAEIADELNQRGLGAFWLGGNATVLAVHFEVGGTHIAGLPVAMTISCHALRRAEIVC